MTNKELFEMKKKKINKTDNIFYNNERNRKVLTDRKKDYNIKRTMLSFFTFFMLFSMASVILFSYIKNNTIKNNNLKAFELPSWIEEDYLTINPYSRPGTKLPQVNSIVIHFVGNEGSTAKNNRDYFEGLKDTHERKASSHFIVGLDGEIINCVPLSEVSYASNTRNKDTIAIEHCHPDITGKFNDATYDSSIKLTAYLCYIYGLDSSDLLRHYDISGKFCPLYFVEHEDAWEQYKADTQELIDKCIENEKNK